MTTAPHPRDDLHGAHGELASGRPAGHDAHAAAVIDPVCGMTVDPHATAHRHLYRGESYYFCSAGCRTRFAADPAKYLGPRPAEPAAP